jgi:hypothetical protein
MAIMLLKATDPHFPLLAINPIVYITIHIHHTRLQVAMHIGQLLSDPYDVMAEST